MKAMHCFQSLAAMLGCVLYCGSAIAELPTVSYIFPAGAQRGTTTKVHVGGHFLHGEASFAMHGSGVTASPRVTETATRWFEGPLVVKPASQAAENYPRDHEAQVTIAADAQPGIATWRVWTSQGGTTARPFVIGHLPEVLEAEMDGAALPQPVTLPVTANGRIFPREDVDVWEFTAMAGQSISCEVHAARIASPLDSHLEVRGPDGQRIAENGDHFGTDSRLRFTAPETGVYQVRIWDAEFRGLQDFVYRLTITNGPYVDRVFPAGGKRGEIVSMKLFGQNVPADPVTVTLPTDRTGVQTVYLPLANQPGHLLTNAVTIDIGETVEAVESAATREAEHTLPVNLNGVISAAGEVDTWRIRAAQGQPIDFELMSLKLGSPLDAVLNILDASGKSLAQSGSTLDNPLEAKGTFAVPADGVYQVTIRDVSPNRGGESFLYRLRLAVVAPDYRLRVATDALSLPRGGEVKTKVNVERIGGFAGEIELQIPNLPAGVTLANNKIAANANEVEISLKADAKAKIQAIPLRLEGVAKIGETPATRVATMPVVAQGVSAESLLLAIAMPTPFKIDGGELQIRYGARGTIFRRKFAIERNGYTGPLSVRLADRQVRHLQGVTGPTIDLPLDATEFEYPVMLPTWLETNRTTRTILMVTGEVPDEDGVRHKVSFSSGDTRNQIALLTAPCPLSIRAESQSMRANSGDARELNVTIARGTLSAAPAKIELVLPEHLRGVSADPLTIPADQSTGRMKLHFAAPLGPFTMPITIRATTMHENDPVIAECKLELVAGS